MAVYCTIVYAWSWWVGPLGPDIARLAGEGNLTAPAAWALDMAASAFTDQVLPYHLVNTLLIYASMVCIYLIVNRLTGAPTWLGVFAANLWMASPGHREATVALTGMVDLLPCLAALLALTAFMAHGIRPTATRLAALLVLLGAALVFPENQWIGAVLLLFGLIMRAGDTGEGLRTLVGLAAVFAGLFLHARPSLEAAGLFDRYGALYFCFYGIGLLPDTAERLASSPWLNGVAAAVVGTMIVLIHRKAARPAFLVAILGMFVYRSNSAVQPVDPVHLTGAGSLVFATALFMIGVGVLYARAMDHKRWSPILGLSSITISAVFFLLMITTISPWREASRLSQAYRVEAAAAHAETAAAVLVAPDFQAMRGAPLQLSSQLSHETAFGPRIPHVAALPIDYAPRPGATYAFTQAQGLPRHSLVIHGPDARAVQRPWERAVPEAPDSDEGFVLPLPPSTTLLPDSWVAFGEVSWDESD